MYGKPDRKSIPRFTKSPSLVLIRPVLTEIQAFKNVKNLQRNVWKTGQIRTLFGIVRHEIRQLKILKSDLLQVLLLCDFHSEHSGNSRSTKLLQTGIVYGLHVWWIWVIDGWMINLWCPKTNLSSHQTVLWCSDSQKLETKHSFQHKQHKQGDKIFWDSFKKHQNLFNF